MSWPLFLVLLGVSVAAVFVIVVHVIAAIQARRRVTEESEIRRMARRMTADHWAFLRRLRCRHQRGHLLAIEFDGESVYECADCGKHVRIPLS